MPGPGGQPLGGSISLKFLLETRLQSESFVREPLGGSISLNFLLETRLQSESSTSSNEVESIQNDILRDNSLIISNDTLFSMGQSPVKLQSLASHNKKAYGKRKLDQIYVASHANLSKVPFVDEIVQHEDVPVNSNENDDEEPLNNMISRMKKITNSTSSTRAQKIQVLSLAPSCWSFTKVADVFNVSERMVHDACSIEIFSLPPPQKGKTLKESVG